MKKTVLLMVILLVSLHSHAQWGIKGGLNYSTMTGYTQSKYMLFGHIGGTYETKLSEKWYIQPELLFSAVGCNLKDDGVVLKDGHINIYALELPVNLSFRPYLTEHTKLVFDVGLYARYGLFGNKTYKYYNDPKVDKSPFDSYNRFDTGFNLGIGIQKHQVYSIFGFQRGLSHAEKGVDSYHQVFRLSVGYKFF